MELLWLVWPQAPFLLIVDIFKSHQDWNYCSWVLPRLWHLFAYLLFLSSGTMDCWFRVSILFDYIIRNFGLLLKILVDPDRFLVFEIKFGFFNWAQISSEVSVADSGKKYGISTATEMENFKVKLWKNWFFSEKYYGRNPWGLHPFPLVILRWPKLTA